MQGEFTRQEARQIAKEVEELFEAIPKSRRMEYIGHLNDILLFIGAAEKHAPDELVQGAIDE